MNTVNVSVYPAWRARILTAIKELDTAYESHSTADQGKAMHDILAKYDMV